MYIAIEQLLEKCYDNKMVKLPGDSYYRGSFMQLINNNKKRGIPTVCFTRKEE